MRTRRLRLRHLLCIGLCLVMMCGSHALAVSTYTTGSVGNSSAKITGSARMQADSDSSKDFCAASGTLGGSDKEYAKGTVTGKIQGIDVKAITIPTGTLKKGNYSYTWSKTVKDDYCVMSVVLKLNGIDSKTIYASH